MEHLKQSVNNCFFKFYYALWDIESSYKTKKLKIVSIENYIKLILYFYLKKLLVQDKSSFFDPFNFYKTKSNLNISHKNKPVLNFIFLKFIGKVLLAIIVLNMSKR